MNSIWLLGFSASAIGMLSGGAIAWLFQGWQRGTPTIFSICSGMIFGLVTMEILPESIEIGGWFIAIVGLIFGYFIYKYLEKVSHHVIIITNDAKKDLFVHSGLFLTFSIALHNFPTGIALGANTHDSLTKPMMTTIMLHNIPEGIAVFTPLLMAGFGILSIILGATIASVPVGVGAFIGNSYGMGVPWLAAMIIALAMGLMLSVTGKEIFGTALRTSAKIYCVIMAIIGFILVSFYLFFL
ncbi:ZIP family metal transporter [Parageobacillus sp. VR-IP]|jgi:zinc transporter, ZIP family|uniref:ZIP family metal transporter n=1 Tax=Parageobacillus sp. VR-IP TaxID=2742205 RepID=UPI001582FF8E|nr:ZIP family metal transporter [Parageobacillus sp. VR-IP]NUK30452.1 ZIP family metal transporter [Parageobacillus sp. VR-IP]